MKLNFIPVGRDYVTRQPKWSTVPYDGEVKGWRGLVCGKLSDNVEVIDVDIKNDPNRTIVVDYLKAIPKPLLAKMVVQSTKSKGVHLIYRCDEINGNIWLAKDTSGKVIIETRGEGGYINVVPTKGYAIMKGKTFDDIQTITKEERDQLFDIARGLNRLIKAEPLPWEDEPVLKPVAESKPKGGLTVSSHISNSVQGELKALGDAAKALLNSPILLTDIGSRDVWRDRILFPLSQLAKDFPEIQDKVKGIFDMICKKAEGSTKNNDKEWVSALKSSRDDIGFASFIDFVGQVEVKKELPKDILIITPLRDIMDKEFPPISYYVENLINTRAELVLIFGDTGSGKTTFCYHLANSIAGGTELFEGLINQSSGKRVLYLDFEFSDEQAQDVFISREMVGTKMKVYRTEVSENLHRASLDWTKLASLVDVETAVMDMIYVTVDDYDIIFIDNLMMLIYEQEKSTDAKNIVSKMKGLVNSLGKKVFLITHTPKKDRTKSGKTISIDDSSGSKVIANMSDSVIACGKNQDKGTRFVKQLKSREAKLITYDDENTIVTQLSKGKLEYIDQGFELKESKERTETDWDKEMGDKKTMILDLHDAGLKADDITKRLKEAGYTKGIDKSAIGRTLKGRPEQKKDEKLV